MAVFNFAAKGQVDKLTDLLQSTKEVANAVNKQGQTPLMIAADAGEHECVEVLLQNGADVKAKDKAGQTPLLIACSGGYAEIALQLIEYKSDVNVTDANGSTVLHHAVRLKLHDVARALLKRGADVNALDQMEGLNPLMMAVQNLDTDMVELLCDDDKCKLDLQDVEGNTVLHYAVKASDPELIDLLASKGAAVNQQNYQGYTALHAAYAQFKTNAGAFVRALEKHGIDGNLTDLRGRTAKDLVNAKDDDDDDANHEDSRTKEDKQSNKRMRKAEVDEETSKWLESIGLSHLAETFARKRINMDSIRDLSTKSIKKLNITQKDKDALLKAIESLPAIADDEKPAQGSAEEEEKNAKEAEAQARKTRLYIFVSVIIFFIALYFLFNYAVEVRKGRTEL